MFFPSHHSLFFDAAWAFQSAAPVSWPAGVASVMTTRYGGCSVLPHDSWNLGDHVFDDSFAVAQNRQLLAQRLDAKPVFLSQVHGVGVQELRHDTPDGLQADVCWTDAIGVACTVMVADCLPILFAAADGRSVAAVHAGWRGLLGQHGHGVLEALAQHWPAAQSAIDRQHTQVWLGPCIGPQVFEVGAEVQRAYVALDPAMQLAFTPIAERPQQFLANLPHLARWRLQRLGFEHIGGNDGSAAWCTLQQASVFFSHRRDAVRFGSTGRMAACIWRYPI